ncbi:MAG: hypothetical protein NT092_07435 [Bacteroidia bacterium]|nr:hypothetical protein [Bacteroidia bacterium]
MNRSDKKFKELAAVLKKRDISIIRESIQALRNEETFEGAVSLLASYYDQCSEKLILRAVEEFFNDLKDQSVRPEMVAEIRKPWKPETISMLVASCWQSGLDYSDYLGDMARTFLKADYATSIECMTVIEGSIQNSTRARKDEIINLIMESPQAFLNEKNALVHELIAILER